MWSASDELPLLLDPSELASESDVTFSGSKAAMPRLVFPAGLGLGKVEAVTVLGGVLAVHRVGAGAGSDGFGGETLVNAATGAVGFADRPRGPMNSLNRSVMSPRISPLVTGCLRHARNSHDSHAVIVVHIPVHQM